MQGDGVLQPLIAAAQEAWDNIKENALNKLSNTMPHRVCAALAVDGWYTKY